jgi:hypothetical protein
MMISIGMVQEGMIGSEVARASGVDDHTHTHNACNGNGLAIEMSRGLRTCTQVYTRCDTGFSSDTHSLGS